MNKYRRTGIRNIILKLEELKDDIEALLDEEQEYYDNMPENLQYGERGENSQSAIDSLEEAICNVDDCISNLEEAVEN